MNNRKNGTKPVSSTLARIGKGVKPVQRDVSWEVVKPQLLYELIVAVNDAHGALLFGVTSDRGAWAITIYHDGLPGNKKKEYCSSEADLEEWLQHLVELWQDVARELAS